MCSCESSAPFKLTFLVTWTTSAESPPGAPVAGHAAASGGTRKFLSLNPLPRCSAGNKVVFLMLRFTHSAAR
ncbi:hypothetical protein EYF80_056053 [Liparis tanakae]|uniref:Uncharacterized protein n=1 Tax=Liparis tanakae TaxID=230148 RepID=A0A4Z2EXU8_9TELE|nr:hypothetical protein EYF80_056053 [Liparis tanakae]